VELIILIIIGVVLFLIGAWLERKAIQTYGEYWKDGLEEDPVKDENGEYFKVEAINQGTIWKSRNPFAGFSEEQKAEMNRRLDELGLEDIPTIKARKETIEKVRQEVMQDS